MNASEFYRYFKSIGLLKPALNYLFKDELTQCISKSDYSDLFDRIVDALKLNVFRDKQNRITFKPLNLKVEINDSPFTKKKSFSSTQIYCNALTEHIVKLCPNFEPLILEQALQSISEISLAELYRYCWDAGVPLIPIYDLHRSFAKPYSLLHLKDGRPVIYIGANPMYQDKLKFSIVYCLVIIAENHAKNGMYLNEGNPLFDFHFNIDETLINSYEVKTNRLLSNDTNLDFSTFYSYNSAIALACTARQEAKKQKVTASYLLARFANETFSWDTVEQAIAYLPEALIEEELLPVHLDKIIEAAQKVDQEIALLKPLVKNN